MAEAAGKVEAVPEVSRCSDEAVSGSVDGNGGNTYADGSSLMPPFFPFSSRLGTVRLESPNSSAIPSSLRPKKSSPKDSAKLPLDRQCKHGAEPE